MADQRARVDAEGKVLRDGNGRLIPEPGLHRHRRAAEGTRLGRGLRAGPAQRRMGICRASTGAAARARERPLNACFTCHLQARAQQDFSFTTWDYANRTR